MAEEPKQAFDPDATDRRAAFDPDATVAQPTPSGDPDTTITGPAFKQDSDPEATDIRQVFDPEATDRRAAFDPDATVRRPSLPRSRKNPFAPKSPPETIQANLSALGGINPLVVMANPILAAVPQIRRTLKHPAPATLLANLRDQIESLETSALSAELSGETINSAVYALCALLDESAAATPWGGDWVGGGLLQAICKESNGAEGFFTRLDRILQEPEKNADLIEFHYICLALGFEGRYRGAEGGRQALDELRDRLYGLIARRRPRPEGLSANWRTPAAQAAVDAALKTAARANAARAAAEEAARAAETSPKAAAAMVPASRFALSRWPRRAIWSGVAGIVGASIVLYMLGIRLLDDATRNALSPGRPDETSASAQASASVAAPTAAAAALSASLAGLPVTVVEKAGTVTLVLRDDRQFASGSAIPAAPVRALVQKVAESLDLVPGAILVAGHADATPAGLRYASNAELSAARARAVARLMAGKLADPKRLATVGKAAAEPVAPNDSEANRAKNRRVVIELKPAP